MSLPEYFISREQHSPQRLIGTLKSVRAAMSVLPLQAVVMNGQHLADPFFAPTPPGYLGYLS